MSDWPQTRLLIRVYPLSRGVKKNWPIWTMNGPWWTLLVQGSPQIFNFLWPDPNENNCCLYLCNICNKNGIKVMEHHNIPFNYKHKVGSDRIITLTLHHHSANLVQLTTVGWRCRSFASICYSELLYKLWINCKENKVISVNLTQPKLVCS